MNNIYCNDTLYACTYATTHTASHCEHRSFSQALLERNQQRITYLGTSSTCSFFPYNEIESLGHRRSTEMIKTLLQVLYSRLSLININSMSHRCYLIYTIETVCTRCLR